MYCAKCGNELIAGTKFCGKCGNPVSEQVTEGKSDSNSGKSTKKILGSIVSVMFFIIAFGGVRYLTQEGVNSISNPSKQEIIHQTVELAKTQASLPQELDEVTTWTDIKETTGAIRYEYTLHDIDESQVSNAALRNILVPSVCQNQNTRNILDKDINMEYSYKVENSLQTYLVSISKSDCI